MLIAYDICLWIFAMQGAPASNTCICRAHLHLRRIMQEASVNELYCTYVLLIFDVRAHADILHSEKREFSQMIKMDTV